MITPKTFEIAVILINYNSGNFTIDCIKTIIEKTNPLLSYQIIIVDNASDSEDFEIVRSYCNASEFKHLRLIRSNINNGFGGGNMMGVHHANAEYFAFINNDSLLLNDCLLILHTAMKNNPKYGICGPLCFKEDMSLLPTIDHFASPAKELMGRKVLEKINPERYPNRKKIYSAPQQAQFVSGSFMMVKADDFAAVNGFDKNIFLYYEETDLCRRLLQNGKKAFLIPEARFVHFQGVSTPKSMLIKIESKISFLYIIRKHHGILWHRILLSYLQVQYFIKSLFKPRYWSLCKVLFKGASIDHSLKNRQETIEI